MTDEQEVQKPDAEAEEVLKEVTEETPKPDEGTGTETEQVEIPMYLAEAGRAAGLDEATIADLAANDIDRLKDLGMAYLSSKFRTDGTKKVEQEPVEETPPPEAIGHVSVELPHNADAPTKQLIQSLVETQNKLIDAFNGNQQKVFELEQRTAVRDTQGQAEFEARVDGFFDKKANEVPSLGLSSSLTPQQDAARRQVYQLASVIKGTSMEDRLDKAVKAYEGMSGSAEQNLRRKLDVSKKRFSPRPTGQKVGTSDKSGDAEAYKAMMESASRLGIKFNQG